MAVRLRRNTAPLLSQVGGQPRNTNARTRRRSSDATTNESSLTQKRRSAGTETAGTTTIILEDEEDINAEPKTPESEVEEFEDIDSLIESDAYHDLETVNGGVSEIKTSQKSDKGTRQSPTRKAILKCSSGIESSPSAVVESKNGKRKRAQEEVPTTIQPSLPRLSSGSDVLEDDPHASKFERWSQRDFKKAKAHGPVYSSQAGSQKNSTTNGISSANSQKNPLGNAAKGSTFKHTKPIASTSVSPPFKMFARPARLSIAAQEPVAFHTSNSSPLQITTDGVLDTYESSPLSTPASSPEPEDPPDTARCPLCKSLVPLDLYNEAGGPKLISSYGGAMAFCTRHKAADAKERLRAAQYPEIDWVNLDQRLSRHHETLEAILEQRVDSSFRRELQNTINSGQGRNALRNPDHAARSTVGRQSMGYYGARGESCLTEHIMDHLSGKIREVAGNDELFAEVGVPGFVQSVLVPELLVLLVREDWDCDEEEAKVILDESGKLGEGLGADEGEEGKVGEAVGPCKKDQTGGLGAVLAESKNRKGTEIIEIFSQESRVDLDDSRAPPRQTRARRKARESIQLD